jgi:hypothetical protein
MIRGHAPWRFGRSTHSPSMARQVTRLGLASSKICVPAVQTLSRLFCTINLSQPRPNSLRTRKGTVRRRFAYSAPYASRLSDRGFDGLGDWDGGATDDRLKVARRMYMETPGYFELCNQLTDKQWWEIVCERPGKSDVPAPKSLA